MRMRVGMKMGNEKRMLKWGACLAEREMEIGVKWGIAESWYSGLVFKYEIKMRKK